MRARTEECWSSLALKKLLGQSNKRDRYSSKDSRYVEPLPNSNHGEFITTANNELAARCPSLIRVLYAAKKCNPYCLTPFLL